MFWIDSFWEENHTATQNMFMKDFSISSSIAFVILSTPHKFSSNDNKIKDVWWIFSFFSDKNLWS